MSRYYDPVTHRFLNVDGYFQSGNGILDTNMNAYCNNNPVMNSDQTGESCRKHACYYVGSCEACNPDLYRLRRSRPGFVAKAYSAGSKKGGDWKPRKDSRKACKLTHDSVTYNAYNLQGLENVIKLILMVKNIVEFQKAMDLNAMIQLLWKRY